MEAITDLPVLKKFFKKNHCAPVVAIILVDHIGKSGVMVKALDSRNVLREFKLQSRYYVQIPLEKV